MAPGVHRCFEFLLAPAAVGGGNGQRYPDRGEEAIERPTASELRGRFEAAERIRSWCGANIFLGDPNLVRILRGCCR
ncbi:hypothetical protein A6U87_13105 [Rhizobium sp. AC44/96]|nr:hypothetical protein A6U87_13105 [Rhizobium sp. AC44/96]